MHGSAWFKTSTHPFLFSQLREGLLSRQHDTRARTKMVHRGGRLATVSRHLVASSTRVPSTSSSATSSSSELQALVPEDAETQYAEQGYFVVRQLLPADAVRRVHAEVGRILSGHTHGNSDGYIRDYTRTDGRGGAPGTPGEMSGPDSVRVLRDPRCQSSVLWNDWLTHPNVGALQRRMLGENVRVMGTSFFTKAPGGVGEATPLHQDLCELNNTTPSLRANFFNGPTDSFVLTYSISQ